MKTTLLSYCDFLLQWKVSMQKITLIHQLQVSIELIYESRKLPDHRIYEPTLPKSFKSWLTFPKSLSTYKISSWLTSSFLRNCCFNLTGPEYFWPQSPFTFPHSLSTCKTSQRDQIALEIWLVYESCNLISQEHSHPCNNKNLQITFHVSWMYIYIPEIKLIHQFLIEI